MLQGCLFTVRVPSAPASLALDGLRRDCNNEQVQDGDCYMHMCPYQARITTSTYALCDTARLQLESTVHRVVTL